LRHLIFIIIAIITACRWPITIFVRNKIQRLLFVLRETLERNSRDKRQSWIQEFIFKIFYDFWKIVVASDRATDNDKKKMQNFIVGQQFLRCWIVRDERSAGQVRRWNAGARVLPNDLGRRTYSQTPRDKEQLSPDRCFRRIERTKSPNRLNFPISCCVHRHRILAGFFKLSLYSFVSSFVFEQFKRIYIYNFFVRKTPSPSTLLSSPSYRPPILFFFVYY
jgi:hypothetical protein